MVDATTTEVAAQPASIGTDQLETLLQKEFRPRTDQARVAAHRDAAAGGAKVGLTGDRVLLVA